MSTKEFTSKDLIRDYGTLSFGEVLRSMRECADLSQAAFAKKLAISPANLCDLEKGRKIPSAKRATQFAMRLKLPPALLVQIALQDSLIRQKLNFRVSVAA